MIRKVNYCILKDKDIMHLNKDIEARTANMSLAKVSVQCSADTFVVDQTLVLRINICNENRHLRQARKLYKQP